VAPLVSNLIELEESCFEDVKNLLDELIEYGADKGVSHIWLLKTIIIVRSLNKSHSDLL